MHFIGKHDIMALTSLTALSPLDGRYSSKVEPLRRHFSELGLIRYRVQVEIAWLKALAAEPGIKEVPPFSAATRRQLDAVVSDFSEADGAAVKAIEARTNHDVKAIEYFLKDKLGANAEIAKVAEFIHFACTSEDINNLCHALMLKAARDEVMLPALGRIVDRLAALAHELADAAMLARTHGQPASPTTLGKELANVVARLRRARDRIAAVKLLGKSTARSAITTRISPRTPVSIGKSSRAASSKASGSNSIPTRSRSSRTTQSPSCSMPTRAPTPYCSTSTAISGVTSRSATSGRKPKPARSAPRPCRTRSIRSTSRIRKAISASPTRCCAILSDKLPVSRWQRDLTDSTVLRNMGVALGHTLLAYDSCLKGLAKLEANRALLAADLDANWEVLAEPIQTVMRRYGVSGAYEQLKDLTRGKDGITRESLHAFIKTLAIPAAEKKRLLALTPATYIGKAAELAKKIPRLLTTPAAAAPTGARPRCHVPD